jgi:hypothetical protein
MTEEVKVSTAEEVFGALSVPKILIATLQTLGEIVVPTDLFLNAGTEDQELKVDYNSDNQTFTFKLKENNVREEDI